MKKDEEKIEVMIDEFLRLEKTTNFIKEFRSMVGIPIEGFNLTQEDINDIENQVVLDLFVPNRELSPTDENILSEIKKGKKIQLFILSYCKAYVSDNFLKNNRRASAYLVLQLFFSIVPVVAREKFVKEDFLEVLDFPSTFDEYGYDRTHNGLVSWLKYLSASKPVAILIDPNISLNSFKKLVSLNWKNVENLRSKKEIGKYKSRGKPKQQINDFIYKNRHLKISAIGKKLSKDLGVILDDGHISAIRDQQIKKRKLTNTV